MEWRIINSKNSIYFLVLFFFLLYAFGATNNSSLDAWAYAADVSKGDNLFAPHHLLYSLLGYLWVGVINIFADADVLVLLKLLNAVFAAAILFVLFRFLGFFNNNTRINLLLVALAGSSWGITRFATENETYIVPLFFSLLGSFLLIKGESKKNIIFSGLFAALATLFHQVMFFWWLGLMLGLVFKRNIKNIMIIRNCTYVFHTKYLRQLQLVVYQIDSLQNIVYLFCNKIHSSNFVNIRLLFDGLFQEGFA